MEYALEWSDRSRANLKAIESYIAEDSLFHAKKVVNEVIDRAEDLKTFPEMGRVLPDFPHLGLRELIEYSYRVIYSFDGSTVVIVAVVHVKQKYIEGFLRG